MRTNDKVAFLSHHIEGTEAKVIKYFLFRQKEEDQAYQEYLSRRRSSLSDSLLIGVKFEGELFTPRANRVKLARRSAQIETLLEIYKLFAPFTDQKKPKGFLEAVNELLKHCQLLKIPTDGTEYAEAIAVRSLAKKEKALLRFTQIYARNTAHHSIAKAILGEERYLEYFKELKKDELPF